MAAQRQAPAQGGVELLNVVDRPEIHAALVGLYRSAAEAVGKVGTDGDRHQRRVAVQQVVEARTRQGVAERHQLGAARSPVGVGGVPLGDRHPHGGGSGVAADQRLQVAQLGRAALQIGGIVEVRAGVAELLACSCQHLRRGVGGEQPDARVDRTHGAAERGEAALVRRAAHLVADLPVADAPGFRPAQLGAAAAPATVRAAVAVLDQRGGITGLPIAEAHAHEGLGIDRAAELQELVHPHVARLRASAGVGKGGAPLGRHSQVLPFEVLADRGAAEAEHARLQGAQRRHHVRAPARHGVRPAERCGIEPQRARTGGEQLQAGVTSAPCGAQLDREP